MLNKEERRFVEENLGKISLEAIARKLGISAKRLKKEMRQLGLKADAREPSAHAPAYKITSISSKNRRKVLLLALVVFAVTCLVYLNSLKNDFIWDDEFLILHNSQIKSFSHVFNVFRTYIGFGSENVNSFYRPLQELSNMIDYALWRDIPMGFHLTNMILHAAAAALVFLSLFYVCGNLAVSALAAVLFGVHPIQTEAVTYIAGRADPLYAVFFLSAFALSIRYINHTLRGGRKPMFLVWSNLLFVSALLSKELSLIFPLILILYIQTMLKGAVPKADYDRLKNMWIPAVAVLLIYGIVRFQVLNFFKIAPPAAVAHIPAVFRILTFFKTVPVYIGLLILPVGLHMERRIGVVRSALDGSVVVSLLIILCILACGAFLYKKNRPAAFFIFWFFVNLLPVSNIFPINSFIAEHWLYMASVGYFFLAASFIYAVYEKGKDNLPAKIAVVIFTAVIISGYSFLTVARNRDWRDEISFFENTLKYSPNNARLHLNFGNTYYDKGDFDRAMAEYQKAISLNANYDAPHGNIGSIYMTKGNLAAAESHLKRAIEINPRYAIAHLNLGIVYYRMGRIEEAVRELETAVGQMPQLYQAFNYLGRIYMDKNDRDKAAAAFRRSLAIMPGQPDIEALSAKIGRGP